VAEHAITMAPIDGTLVSEWHAGRPLAAGEESKPCRF